MATRVFVVIILFFFVIIMAVCLAKQLVRLTCQADG